MTVELKYIGQHQPPHIVDVDEKLATRLIERGDYVPLIDGAPIRVPSELLTGKWTEKKIKEWLVANQIPIEYDVANQKEADIIKKIKVYFKLE